jgi:carboxymethylenebutenolidase
MSTNEETGIPVKVTEQEVEVRTPDGVCDAAFFAPEHGTYPGVIIWPDAFGLRPTLRDMGRRLAGEGYAVLVPNPYYRVGAASEVRLDTQTFRFQNQDDMARLGALRLGLQASGGAERDALAYAAFLGAQAAVDTNRKIGTVGYCMGGALAFRTGAVLREKIGAVAAFHAGGLVTEDAESPHRLVAKMQAAVYVGIASNDDARQPEVKEILRTVFDAASIPAEIEVYAGLHGWCIADIPVRDGANIYNADEAERAWAKLVALYKSALG